jgi:hypothetical protein
MESMDRRDFLNKATRTGIASLLALDAAVLLKRSTPERPLRTTDDVADYVAPITRIPKEAAESAKKTDGVARIDREGGAIAPSEREMFRETISFGALHKRPPLEFTFDDTIAYPKNDAVAFEKPRKTTEGDPIQLSSIKAMAAHAMRFKPITDAVEKRYALPRGLMTALVMQESTGLDLLPNSRGDGGFGLIHMQNATAHEFGLTVSGDTTKVVDRENGAELAFLMKRDGGTSEGRAVLNAHDERLDLLANVDAAGRMLASWSADPEVSAKYPTLDPLRRAIVRFCGPNNKDTYLGRVALYMSMLNDPQYLEDLYCEFSHTNENRRMPDGSPMTMETWLQEHHDYYGAAYPISEYSKLPLVKTKATDEMSRTYQSAMGEELARFRDSQRVASRK